MKRKFLVNVLALAQIKFVDSLTIAAQDFKHALHAVGQIALERKLNQRQKSLLNRETPRPPIVIPRGKNFFVDALVATSGSQFRAQTRLERLVVVAPIRMRLDNCRDKIFVLREKIDATLRVDDDARQIFDQQFKIGAWLGVQGGKFANGIVAVVDDIQPREEIFRLRLDGQNFSLGRVRRKFQSSRQKFLSVGKQRIFFGREVRVVREFRLERERDLQEVCDCRRLRGFVFAQDVKQRVRHAQHRVEIFYRRLRDCRRVEFSQQRAIIECLNVICLGEFCRRGLVG